MTTVHPESPGDFEFIVTPAAPEQTKPAFDCGVKTTLVSNYRNSTYISEAALASTFLRMNLIFFSLSLVPRYQKCSCPRRLARQR